MKMELIEGSETSAISIVTPGNYPKENILHTEHGESLKSRIRTLEFSILRINRRQAPERLRKEGHWSELRLGPELTYGNRA